MAIKNRHLFLTLQVALSGILLFTQTVKAKWTEGTIVDKNGDWIFLTRFCFLSKVGQMQYRLEYPIDYETEDLLFYYDVPGQWDAVYKRGLNCTQKVAALKGNNIFNMDFFGIGCKIETRGSRDWYVCRGTMDFSSARERWWYVTVSRCGPPQNTQVQGLYLYYKLHMTNGDDLLHKEFSADEFYILLTDIIFFILYIKIMVLSIICAVVLKKRQLLHTTYRLYLGAVTLWTLHLLCMVIAWGSYGTTGWEMRRMEVLGRIIAAGSNVIFMLMLILLAKGYSIVRGRLTNKAMVKITSFIFLYVVVSIALFIWEGTFFDPGLVLYYYESPPGYCMVAIILLGWLWFTKAAIFTLKHFKAKTNFYIVFYTIYTIWFWAGPVVILIAMFSMAKWTRQKTVNGVQQAVAYLGHLVFLILTMPSKVNTNFPYHIKTTQIGSVPDSDHLTGDDSARTDEDGGGRQTPGAYTLTSGAYYSGTGPNLEFFITTKADGRRAGESGDAMYGPLDVNMFRMQEDSPPPGYSQAISNDENLPAASHDRKETEMTTDMDQPMSHSHANNTEEVEGHSIEFPTNTTTSSGGNRLPPLRGIGERDGHHVDAGGTLPPIRGAVPSAPPVYDEWEEQADHLPHPPPAYADMFRVDNK